MELTRTQVHLERPVWWRISGHFGADADDEGDAAYGSLDATTLYLIYDPEFLEASGFSDEYMQSSENWCDAKNLIVLLLAISHVISTMMQSSTFCLISRVLLLVVMCYVPVL